jgi:hypothetical protein
MKNLIYILFTAILFSNKLKGQSFSSSNLPIIIINTNGNNIEDDPKVVVDFGIIDNGPGQTNNINDPLNGYNGYCGIEFRGNSTQGFDKKNYSIELWTANQTDTSASLLGLPSEEDWILHASHVDKTFIRNTLSYNIWRKIGYWSSNTKYCELVLDGDYRGVYILMEKNKRDNNRVDIAKLDADDNAGDSLTGGYIIRLDWPEGDGFYSNHNSQDGTPLYYQYYYPKANNITNQQKAYIQSYLNNFENALFSGNFQDLSIHYLNHIDITTFADIFIINELSRSVDAYKLSTYIYKDKINNGGKLKAGPIWDFDLAYDNAEYCGGENENGWTYLQAENTCDDLSLMPMWWQEFMSDPIFTNHLKCRWEFLKQDILDINNLNSYIDSITSLIDNAQTRNFQRWPVLGVDLFAQPSPIPTTYNQEINIFKAWLVDRLNWIDNNIPGNCNADVVSNQEISINKTALNIFPNPSKYQIFIETSTDNPIKDIEIYDLTGKLTLKKVNLNKSLIEISLTQLKPGLYQVFGTTKSGVFNSKIVIEQ